MPTLSTTTIPTTELAELRRKGIAHDDYLKALRLSQKRLSVHRIKFAAHGSGPVPEQFVIGYRTALNDLAQFIADVSSERLAEAAMVHASGAPELFDRGVPEV